ncbi:2-hydroxyacid dehydrogenase [Methyloprofundus sp.]|uniref:2-hydroxyacid dehydrogenase n=1 Tax=Methyloprofundus sp. TaxID=2020875 RepID=UPI003D1201A3
MNKPKIFITRKWPDAIEAKLKQRYDVTLNLADRPLSAEEFKTALQEYDAVCPTVCDSFPAEVLNVVNKRCKILANFGVGFNHINTPVAKQQNIAITNTPDVLTHSTADIAMTLLLMSARRGAEGDRLVRNKQWQGWSPTHMLSSNVTGATLGLIGFGRIAQAMARKAHHGFDMNILYFKPSPAEEYVIDDLQATRCETIEELLQKADFVSLHCPGGDATRHLINADRLNYMQPSAHLINTARGDVIDTQALINALKNKQIAGAGLDVYEAEPNVPDELLALDNVSLLPHLGSATLATRIAMGEKVLSNLDAHFSGKPLPNE